MNSLGCLLCVRHCALSLYPFFFILMSVLKRVLISQIRKLKARGLYLVQGHIASQWQSTDVSPIGLTHKAHASPPPFCQMLSSRWAPRGFAVKVQVYFSLSLCTPMPHTSLTVGDMHCSMVKSKRSTGLTCKPSECWFWLCHCLSETEQN